MQRGRCTLGLQALAVHAQLSSAAPSQWSADYPPPLASEGVSHFWGWLGESATALLFPDLLVHPEPVDISAPPQAVWQVLIDFARYGEWNPFHSRVDVVEQDGGRAGAFAVRMEVQMGPLMGLLVSTETIWYVDSTRHILVYGIGADGPSSLRVVYLQGLEGGKGTRFNSYDIIGGYPGLFSRGYIHGVVLDGFTAQHEAMRERVHALCNIGALQC